MKGSWVPQSFLSFKMVRNHTGLSVKIRQPTQILQSRELREFLSHPRESMDLSDCHPHLAIHPLPRALVTWANSPGPRGVLNLTEKAKHRHKRLKNTEKQGKRKYFLSKKLIYAKEHEVI